MMKLPIEISLRHRGKSLGLDSAAETITLLGPTGEPLGTVSWEAVIDFIQGYVKEARSHQAVRNYPRSRLAAKVRYVTPDHKHFDSVTCEIGGGGIFIETHLPPQLGTTLSLELVLCPTIRPHRSMHKAKWPGSGLGRNVMCSFPGGSPVHRDFRGRTGTPVEHGQVPLYKT